MAGANSYLEGSLVRVNNVDPTGTPPGFVNSSGALADPTTVKFYYEREDIPGETTLVYGVDGALVKESTGIYHVDLDTTSKPGAWIYRWEGTGSVQAASRGKFTVTDDPLV